MTNREELELVIQYIHEHNRKAHDPVEHATEVSLKQHLDELVKLKENDTYNEGLHTCLRKYTDSLEMVVLYDLLEASTLFWAAYGTLDLNSEKIKITHPKYPLGSWVLVKAGKRTMRRQVRGVALGYSEGKFYCCYTLNGDRPDGPTFQESELSPAEGELGTEWRLPSLSP